ncbi:MAG: hypothetical protein R3E32_10175 [Chitinophagales bacterium]
MEHYPKALDIYEQNHAEIQAYPKVKNRFLCIKVMCYALSKQTEKELQCIPENIRQLPPDQYYYLRFIQLIFWYQMEDWEGSLQETENFLKVLNYVNEPHFDADYKQLAYFYLDFFKAISTIPMTQKQNLIQLQTALIVCKNSKSAHNDYLLLMWLEKEVEELLNG